MSYPRDLVGYGQRPPHAEWPGGARLALQIVMNWEEGSERSILHGDDGAETYLHEVPGTAAVAGARNLQIGSTYEYGTRAGLWRLLGLFRERAVPISVFAVGMAVDRYPEAARAIVEGARGGESRLALDRLPVRQRKRRARAHRAGGRQHRARGRRPAARLVHGPPEPEHAAARRRGGRVPVRRGRVQRRSPVLGGGRGPAASRGALYAGQQRHEVRDAARVRHRRRLLHLPARRLRRPPRRRRRSAEDDVGRPAHAARRAAGAVPRARALSRPRPAS